MERKFGIRKKPERSALEIVEREHALSADLVNYVDQWVAVNDSIVVANELTLRELLQKIEEEDIVHEGCFLVEPPSSGANLFSTESAA